MSIIKCIKCNKIILPEDDINGETVPLTHKICHKCYLNMKEKQDAYETTN